MTSGLLLRLVTTFGMLSLLSIGGANATLPEIHRQAVDIQHWMDDATFADLVAIGQAAPGPNVLIVSTIGWHMAGLLGLLTTSAAIVVPSSLVAVAVGRLLARFANVSWVGMVRKALAPIAVGLMLASSCVMSKAAYQGWISLAIVASVAAMIALTRKSPLIGIAAGALVGICGHRLQMFG